MADKKKGGAAEPKQPSTAARKAAVEAATPLEAFGPSAEHEDYEGGMTDSLARKGARTAVPHNEDGTVDLEGDDKTPKAFREPSVRDRQALNVASLAQGGRGVRAGRHLAADASPADTKEYNARLQRERGIQPGSTIVPVIALRVGHYPHDGRLRAVGEGFDYVMGPNEEKLPSWMEDPSGALETLGEFEVVQEVNPITATIQVRRDGTTSVK